MSFVALLNESLVKVDLESADKEELFEEMVDMLARAGKIEDRKPILKAIREREAKMTTGIGKGVAIPHAKTDAIEGVVACVGTGKDGIEYEAIDGEPVHLVFMLVSAETSPELNVQTLASIARLMGLPRAYSRLCAAKSPTELLAELTELESEE